MVAPEPSARQALRAGTRGAHEEVDRLFGTFDLSRADHYGRFLLAHADALLPVEVAIDNAGTGSSLPDWPSRRRGDLLRADLAALGLSAPPPSCDPPVPFTAAGRWGAIYVLEGSRLGGALLQRQVASDLPRAYLDAAQPPGAWRKLLETLDATLYDEAKRADAICAAVQVFGRFAAAARAQQAEACP